MREYIIRMNKICAERFISKGMSPKYELIRCKDCRFRGSELECTQFDAYTSAAGDLFTPPDWFYCGYGERKEK